MSAEELFTQACQRCWRRKQKCSRQRPECSECVAANARCVPRLWGRSLENESAVSGLDGPRVSHIEQLKNKIKALESPRRQVSSSEQAIINSMMTARPDSFSGSAVDDSERPEQEDPGMREVGYLSVAAMSGPDGQNLPLQDNPSFATLVRTATKLVSGVENTSMHNRHSIDLVGLQRDLLATCHCDLRYFISQYCNNGGLIYPCASRALCLEALDRTVQVGASTTSPQEDLLLVCLVASLGIINGPHSQAAASVLEQLAAVSLALLPIVAAEASDVEAVRCLLLASILAMYRFEEAASWHFLGLAMTKAISTGMHCQKPQEGSFGRDSTPLFWTLYTLDRSFAFVLDRPLSIESGDMTVQLPEISASPSHDHCPLIHQAYFVCNIKYAEMMSVWRRQLVVDSVQCYPAYEYWYDTCTEIIEPLKDPAEAREATSASSAAVLNSHKQKLACRALTYLLFVTTCQMTTGALDQRLSNALRTDVPSFLNDYRSCLDMYIFAPTILDAYDVVGAVVAYICVLRMPPDTDGASQRASIAHLGVAEMRAVHMAMDALQKMARGFEPILDFQELLWCFLSALEKKAEAELRTDNDPEKTLREGFAKCRVTVSDLLVTLMTAAIR